MTTPFYSKTLLHDVGCQVDDLNVDEDDICSVGDNFITAVVFDAQHQQTAAPSVASVTSERMTADGLIEVIAAYVISFQLLLKSWSVRLLWELHLLANC